MDISLWTVTGELTNLNGQQLCWEECAQFHVAVLSKRESGENSRLTSHGIECVKYVETYMHDCIGKIYDIHIEIYIHAYMYLFIYVFVYITYICIDIRRIQSYFVANTLAYFVHIINVECVILMKNH